MEKNKKPPSKKIDFAAINAAALSRFESLLRQWLPEGKKSGTEYTALNPTRADTHLGSFSINIHQGVWCDYATSEKGSDPISLYAYLFHQGNQGAAAKELGNSLGVSDVARPDNTKPKKLKSEWTAIKPPSNAPKPPKAHRYRGLPEKTYEYKDVDGMTLGYVCRFVASGGGKDVLPLTWCRHGQTCKAEWRWKSFEVPRYLYGLDRLAKKPNATVLLVEGEKCADSAADQLPDLACLTWPGGAKAVDKTDWQPLARRNVIIWPDCDAQRDKSGRVLPEIKQPGIVAAYKIAQILLAMGCRVRLVNISAPGEKKSGWDIADAIAEGLIGFELKKFLRNNTRKLTKKELTIKSASPGHDVALTERKNARETLSRLIDETGDFDTLTKNIVLKVASAELDRPSMDILLKKIAKKAGVPKSSLHAVIDSVFNRKGPHDTQDNDGQINELNLRHAVIPIGGRILILNNDYDPVMNRHLLTFSSRGDFETRYCNQMVFHKGEAIGLGSYWLHHPRRQQYDGMVFSPGQDQPGYLNLWQGWGVTPQEGDCGKYLDFVRNIICAGDGELFDYVIYWCAHLVQRPQELPETALVFRGVEGAGKDTFISALRDIVGTEHFLMLSSLSQITGRFSGHLANALLVFCNESVWGGDRSAQGVLKSMITDDTQPIEFKGRDLMMVKSYRRMIFATNENWAVPRGADDRRYVIADVSDEKKGDYAYFKAVRDELKQGGTAAVMAYLLSWDIDDWHPRDIPKKLQEAGWELKIRSGGSITQWWYDMLQQGWLDKIHAYTQEIDGKIVEIPEELIWPPLCPVEDVQKHYLSWCLNYRITHPEHSVVLGKAVKEWGFRTSRPGYKGPRPLCYRIPALDEARRIFSEKFSIPDRVWSEHEDGQAFS